MTRTYSWQDDMPLFPILPAWPEVCSDHSWLFFCVFAFTVSLCRAGLLHARLIHIVAHCRTTLFLGLNSIPPCDIHSDVYTPHSLYPLSYPQMGSYVVLISWLLMLQWTDLRHTFLTPISLWTLLEIHSDVELLITWWLHLWPLCCFLGCPSLTFPPAASV